MPHIELRSQKGSGHPEGPRLSVREDTFEYLMTTQAATVRVSAFFDQDYPLVDGRYEELFVSDSCPNVYLVTQIIPGSRTRKKIRLPGPMHAGEQLTILVKREGAEPADSRSQ